MQRRDVWRKTHIRGGPDGGALWGTVGHYWGTAVAGAGGRRGRGRRVVEHAAGQAWACKSTQNAAKAADGGGAVGVRARAALVCVRGGAPSHAPAGWVLPAYQLVRRAVYGL